MKRLLICLFLAASPAIGLAQTVASSSTATPVATAKPAPATTSGDSVAKPAAGTAAKPADTATKPAAAIPNYAAGGTPIAIPSPADDLAEAANDRGLLEIFCPDNNRLIAAYLLAPELAAIKGKDASKTGLTKYALVEVPRAGEYQDCSASDFKQIVDGMQQQLGTMGDSMMSASQDALNKRLKDLNIKDVSISIGKPIMLGRFYSKDDACGYGMVTAVSAAGNTTKIAMALSLVRVKSRVLFVYLYAKYVDDDTIKWLRTTSEAWSDAMLKDNAVTKAPTS